MVVKSIGILIFFCLFAEVTQAEPSILNQYPLTAFVSNRLLPFTLVDTELSEIEIQFVETEEKSNCDSLSDPFYPDKFHLLCSGTGSAKFKVHYSSGSRNFTYQSPEFVILDLSKALPKVSP